MQRMKINIQLEFDEKELGKYWMNIYNLELLLYSDFSTKKELLKINKFKELKK